MPRMHQPRAGLPVIETGGKPDLGETGTRLAILSSIGSCGLSLSGNGWGGARNRRDRVSENLTLRQCEALTAAADRAEQMGLAFNRHWTVHYDRAGIDEPDGARFVGRLLKLAGDYARRHNSKVTAIWVRENGDGKGGHVHILLHLPIGLSLRGRTPKWIRLAGGESREGVSFIRTIGARLVSAKIGGEHYRVNADRVRGYLLKGASREAGEALGLARAGDGGFVIGKRCGRTQNIGKATGR